MNGLMARFRADEPLYNLPEVLGNPLLCLRVFVLLNSIALTSAPLGRDVHHQEDDTWVLDPDFLRGVHYGCMRIATFIISGAYGLNSDHLTSDLPITLPLAALRQIGLPIPSILLMLSYPDNSWIGQWFGSREAALLQGNAYCTYARTGMAWVIECLRRSVLCGDRSEWKFGPLVDMPESVFLIMARESRPSAGLEMCYTRAFDFWIYPALDFDMARLIRPELTHIGIYRDRSACGLALLPFHVQNTEGSIQVGPIDRIIHSTFIRENAIIFFIHNDDAAHNSIVSNHQENTLSLSNSNNSSRASSVFSSSSSSSDELSSTSSGGTVFLY
ncbi:hypothetical protein DFH09DRAFT_1091784 [Mycena vulgaris]|nr:hypothetical protein DFH09DRAFT_1091784 [Mycena vulgaris]